jgi:hypothetical protein
MDAAGSAEDELNAKKNAKSASMLPINSGHPAYYEVQKATEADLAAVKR